MNHGGAFSMGRVMALFALAVVGVLSVAAVVVVGIRQSKPGDGSLAQAIVEVVKPLVSTGRRGAPRDGEAELDAIIREIEDDAAAEYRARRMRSTGPEPADPFWDKVGIVIRTGENVFRDRVPGALLTWMNRVNRTNVVIVSDHNEPGGWTLKWRGHSVPMPRIHDGVTPYAMPGDADSLPSAPAWHRDFVKHFGALKILSDNVPDADWYIMVDDDSYLFTGRVKEFLESPKNNDVNAKQLYAMCYGLDPKSTYWCPNYPNHPKGLYPAGGGGMAFTRAAMQAFRNQLPTCLERYKGCPAGDRRLGACTFDAGIECNMRTGWSALDITQDIRSEKWYLTTVHHANTQLMLFLDRFVEPQDARGPGWASNEILFKYWKWIQDPNAWY